MNEASLGDDPAQRLIGCQILREPSQPIGHTDQLLLVRENSHDGSHVGDWPEVDENATPAQQPPAFTKSRNPALTGQASQRPSQQSDVEGPAAKRQMLCIGAVEVEPIVKRGRSGPASFTNDRGEKVDSHDPGGFAGKLEAQPPVADSDLENARALERNDLSQGAQLLASGIEFSPPPLLDGDPYHAKTLSKWPRNSAIFSRSTGDSPGTISASVMPRSSASSRT